MDLIKSLEKVMKEKELSPERAAGYIGCSGVQIRRWLKGDVRPRHIYREAIKRGIEIIKKEAIS